MKNIFILLAMMLFGSCALQAQDVGFSQFYNKPLLRNPALAGIFACDARFVTSYRNQWQSVTVPYRTFAASAEIKYPTHLLDNSITFTPAVQLMRDVAGTSEFSTIQAMPALNTSLALSDDAFLSIGIMGGLMQQRFDPSKLVLNDQLVSGANGTFSVRPTSGQVFDRTSVNYFDFSTGVSFTNALNESSDYNRLSTKRFPGTNPVSFSTPANKQYPALPASAISGVQVTGR